MAGRRGLMRLPGVLWTTAGLLGAAWLGSGWLELGEASSDVAVFRSAHFPEFLLEDPFGRYVTHEDYRGRFLLVLFAASEQLPLAATVAPGVARHHMRTLADLTISAVLMSKQLLVTHRAS